MTENEVMLPFKIMMESDKEKWRHDSFWQKEPETIAWIKSFGEEDLFFDIGANIGLYSLYFASLYPKGLCIAIEPFLLNFLRLRDNRNINQFTNMQVLWNAFADRTAIMPILINDLEQGASGAQLNQAIDEKGNSFEIKMVDDMVVYSFSDYIMLFDGKPHKLTGRATHIKIDVDGQEDKVLVGTKDFTDIQSMLVEFNNDKQKISEHQRWSKDDWIHEICDRGFTIDNIFNKMEDHSTKRREKEQGNLARNLIFIREEK